MLRLASTYMIAHGVSAILGFASVILFTRLLSPADYGVYVVGMSLAGVVSALLFSWVRLSILRFESEGGAADIRATALAGYGMSVLLTPIALVITVFATGESFDRAAMAVLVALSLALFEFGQEILRARQNSVAYMRAAVLRAVLALGLSFMFVRLGLGGVSLLLGIFLAYLLTSFAFIRSIWQAPLRRFDAATLRQMMAFGLPMAFSGVVFALHAALDRLIVVQYLGDASAGVYGAAADLTRQIILFPAVAVASAVVPMAIRAHANGDRESVAAHLRESGELLLAVVMPAVVGLALVAPNLAALMLGHDFRDDASMLIPVLVFAWLFQSISQQYVQVSFHLAKKPSLLVVHGVATLVVNVAAMIILVPRFQLVGAAWGFVVAEIGELVIGYLLTPFAHPMPLLAKPAFKVASAVLMMAIPVGLIEWRNTDQSALGLVAAVLVGMLVYGLASLVLNIVGSRQVLNKVLARVPVLRRAMDG